MNHQDDYPDSRPRALEWLASRGLCDPQMGAEYVGRKLLSQEAFAQARKEYVRATCNYASVHYPEYIGRFTVRKPNEYPLLEIWHLGLGPNISYGYCVAARPRVLGTDDVDGPGRPPLLVRHGAALGTETTEGSISHAALGELLEPLKHIQVPPYPGDAAFVCDGAIIGFEVVLGSRRFSYQWHTIPPAGWEPLKEWLEGAIHQLGQLSKPPYGY
jgi:hypothetical protein